MVYGKPIPGECNFTAFRQQTVHRSQQQSCAERDTLFDSNCEKICFHEQLQKCLGAFRPSAYILNNI